MTIAIALKVGDGVVLGADSAGTLMGHDSYPANVYFSSEKLFNLVKTWPIGAVTYGLGGLEGRSISSLAKDLRDELTSGSTALKKKSYTIREVADRVKKFFYDDRYLKEFPKSVVDANGNPVLQYASMGFMIAGYSAGATQAEVWGVDIDDTGKCVGPQEIFGKDVSGVANWAGQPEALNRLVRGWSAQVLEGLVASQVPRDEALRFLNALPVEPLIVSAMPIQDAIDLVHFMIDVTCGFVRFSPGPPSVHQPIDSAAITRHEGFKWVRRKHYYSSELNPRADGLGTAPSK